MSATTYVERDDRSLVDVGDEIINDIEVEGGVEMDYRTGGTKEGFRFPDMMTYSFCEDEPYVRGVVHGYVEDDTIEEGIKRFGDVSSLGVEYYRDTIAAEDVQDEGLDGGAHIPVFQRMKPVTVRLPLAEMSRDRAERIYEKMGLEYEDDAAFRFEEEGFSRHYVVSYEEEDPVERALAGYHALDHEEEWVAGVVSDTDSFFIGMQPNRISYRIDGEERIAEQYGEFEAWLDDVVGMQDEWRIDISVC